MIPRVASGNGPPRVSVLLPVHDGSRYLRESLDSVLAQDCEDVEVIACDDASTDDSLAILESYEDSRLQVLRNASNRGLFPTLNALIAASGSNLIRLWAQDDVMYPGCLAAHVEFHRQHSELAMSFCDVDAIDDTGARVARPGGDQTPEVISGELASRIMFLHGSITGNIANVMLTRAALEAVGPFREDLLVSGDFEMWVRMAGEFSLGRLPRRLMALRNHAGQLSRRPGMMAKFIEENGPIFEALLQRLPAEQRARGRRYLRRQVHVSYAHDVVHSLLARDFDTALGTYRALRAVDRPLPTFAWWLLSGNRRWLRLPPHLERR